MISAEGIIAECCLGNYVIIRVFVRRQPSLYRNPSGMSQKSRGKGDKLDGAVPDYL